VSTKHLHVRLTDAERALVQRCAEDLGLPAVRAARRAMEGTLGVVPKANQDLARELRHTRANLAQLLELCDLAVDVEQLDDVQADVGRVFDELTLLQEALLLGEHLDDVEGALAKGVGS